MSKLLPNRVVDPDAEPEDTVTTLPDLNKMAELLYPHEVNLKPTNQLRLSCWKQLVKHDVGTRQRRKQRPYLI